MAVYQEDMSGVTTRAGRLVNYTGAAVSLALIAGVGVWGYKLIMRDVTGIPVVRAMEGEMRVSPVDPGGEVALNLGLAVNAVTAEGEAAAPEDRLALAPREQSLTEEDLVAEPLAEAGEVSASEEDASPEVATDVALPDPTTAGLDAPSEQVTDVLALADQLASGVAPLSALPEGETADPTLLLNGEEITSGTVETIAADVPGVSRSLRPNVRPLGLEVAAAAMTAPAPDAAADAAPTTAAADGDIPITTEDLPVGTKLVQLGAFPSPQIAADTWVQLKTDFSEFMTGKERIIQVASSGGRTFYRLRAKGFEDLADARRFCAALEADNADCIPVVVR
jgi:hypothetical protein